MYIHILQLCTYKIVGWTKAASFFNDTFSFGDVEVDICNAILCSDTMS